MRAGSQADGMLGIIRRFMEEIWNVTAFKAANQQHLTLRVRGNTRQIRAFPAGKKT